MHYPKVLERVDSPEQIFHRSFSLGAPVFSIGSQFRDFIRWMVFDLFFLLRDSENDL